MKKTNAMRLLDQQKISYEVVSFEPEEDMTGVDVAHKNNLDVASVYKTLVTVAGRGEHFVFVIPVARTLDLKAAAQVVGVKKLEMLPQRDLLPLTGYVHGGCSPFAMKKLFPTYLDESAEDLNYIYVSGGKRGLQVGLDPQDVLKATSGAFASISKGA